MSATEGSTPPQGVQDILRESGVHIDDIVVEEPPDLSEGRLHRASEAVTGRFRAAWGIVKGAPRGVKRGILYAKDHPGMIWQQTRGVVLFAGALTFLFLMFNFIYATNPILALLVGLASLGLIVITGQSAHDQIQVQRLVKSKLASVSV